MISKNYSEAIKIPNFIDRFNYLKLSSTVGDPTFGYSRYLNQILYHSPEWKRFRQQIIARDNGCDLAHPDRPLFVYILIHHINPITLEDIEKRRPCVFDPENVICVSKETHNALHYGSDRLLMKDKPTERKPGDTCPWR